MFKFFKKRKKSIQEYIEYVDKKQELYFQLNLFVKIESMKHFRCDLQIFRQDVLEDFNFKDKDGYLILLSFKNDRYENEKHYKKFKESNLLEGSYFLDMYGETYLIPCSNKNTLLDYTSYLLKNVYGHTDSTDVKIEFEKLGKRKAY